MRSRALCTGEGWLDGMNRLRNGSCTLFHVR